MSTPQKANFGELLSKTILPKVHIIALLVAGIGLVFKYLNLGGSADILQVGFSALAAVYFLSGFSMITVAPDSKHSPYALIIFKALYIACAGAGIGFLFYVLQMEGYKEMQTATAETSFLLGVINLPSYPNRVVLDAAPPPAAPVVVFWLCTRSSTRERVW